MSKVKDIFEGDIIDIWEQEGIVFFSTPDATLKFTEHQWGMILKDLKKLVDGRKPLSIVKRRLPNRNIGS